ncbi:MAG: hypothetical protein IKJ01_02500, partial [Lachnospiraceae bacterium]|nr:hypothetical protein [Lachnospiraceae bacterium]
MEQLLRGKEISKINIVDLNKSIQYVPIRHHSPICAWHLKNIIELWKPDCILIEGPENAQEQIPILTHTDTKAPIALYYYYTDKKGLISEKKDEYRCYYPFLDCSPEFVALKEAQNRQIPVFFIDLPYSEILLATKTAKGLRAKTEKQTYNNDYLFSQNQYMKLLCENAGLRDFEEFWEKYFEIKGLYQSTEDFINQMYLYCTLAREHTPIEELEADGCLAREQYMAEQIAEKANIYHKILVVTGGFHTKGIMELLEQKQDKNVEISTDISVSVTEDTFSKRNHCVSKQHIECKKKPQNTDGMEGVYPIAYSMKATDVLNGYASGMQSPAFYQLVWEKLSNISVNDLYTVYEDAVLHQLIKIGRKSRQKKENISSYDIICAFSMAKGLAMLRGKPQAGLYELRDSVLSSFVKGECNLSTDMPLRILEECNTGTQVGSLCKQAPRPPLLLDFEEQCQKFGLQIQEIIYKEVVLQVFTKKKHLEMSRFFYQMEFLETNFARRKKGADLVTGKDRNRIREVWNYEFSTQVLAVLVDVSVFGGTIKEASYTKLLKAFAESKTAKEAAKLITEGFLMGFWEIQLRMAIDMEKILTEDGDFFSLTEAFSYLKMLYELRELYQVEDDAPLEIMIQSCFQKIIQLTFYGKYSKRRTRTLYESMFG